MKLCVLDTETTGISAATNRILEVAAVVYCTVSQTSIAGVHFLVPTTERNPAEHINKISTTALLQPPIPGLVDSFLKMYQHCDCVVAHNADFDKRFVTALWPDLPEKPWVCSQKQINFPKGGKNCRKLSHLAADHDIPVNGAHRAMADVIVLAGLLKMVPDLDWQITRALGKTGAEAKKAAFPQQKVITGSKVLYEVVDTRYDPAKNADYKAAGFRWIPEVRRWRKEVPRGQPPTFPFEVRPAQLPHMFAPRQVSGTIMVADPPQTAVAPPAPPPALPTVPVFDDPADEPLAENESDDDWSL
jgi:DNA polymerase III subunit epsilon